MEYALKYQEPLKALVISNMVSSIPAYNEYAKKVLMPAMDQKALTEILRLESAEQYDDRRYMELLIPHFYTQHILRMPPEKWPSQ
jgi:proline iminopeptidase